MTDADTIRRKRLRIRSWRRGTREMDLILGPFSDAGLPGLDAAGLDLYEVLLEENDRDLYDWVSGQVAPPERFSGIVALIAQARATQ